jgi:hypothetical protein
MRVVNYSFANRFANSLFWLFYLFSFLFLIIKIFRKYNNNAIFIFLVGFLSLIPASFITQTGARIITITVIYFVGICGLLFNSINSKKNKTNKYIYILILFGIFIEANKLNVLYRYIGETQKEREKIIQSTVILQHQNLWNYEKYLIIPGFKKNTEFYTSTPPTTNNSIHFMNFLSYFNLNKNTKVIFDNGFAYESLILQKQNKNLVAEIKPLEDKYKYIFKILRNNQIYFTSEKTNQTKIIIEDIFTGSSIKLIRT